MFKVQPAGVAISRQYRTMRVKLPGRTGRCLVEVVVTDAQPAGVAISRQYRTMRVKLPGRTGECLVKTYN